MWQYFRQHPSIQLIALPPVSYYLACGFLTLESSQKPSQTSFAPHAIATLTYTSLNTIMVGTQLSISSVSRVTNFSQNFPLLNRLGTDATLNVKLPSRMNEVTMRPFPQNWVGVTWTRHRKSPEHVTWCPVYPSPQATPGRGLRRYFWHTFSTRFCHCSMSSSRGDGTRVQISLKRIWSWWVLFVPEAMTPTWVADQLYSKYLQWREAAHKKYALLTHKEVWHRERVWFVIA